jgi:hypothetical protein
MTRLVRSIALFAALLSASISLPLRADDGSGSKPAFAAFESVSVSPSDRSDLSRITEVGVVSADGAEKLVVNLAGELKGRADQDGSVGLFLVPAISWFDALVKSKKALPALFELKAKVQEGESGYFFADQKELEVGFPRYRILIYDTTGVPVSANVYVYRVR